VLYKSQVYTQASGSIGGITYSRNAGGLYTRARATPTNPNSPQQQVVRALVGAISAYWRDTLSAANRALWETYAVNTPIVNRVGDSINISGLAHFVRSNVPRVQSGLALVEAGPTTFGLPSLDTVTVAAVDAAADEVDLTTNLLDSWWTAATSALLVYSSRPQSPTINYFKGPFRFAGKQVGGGVPANPVTVALAFPVVAAQKAFVRVQATLDDGRLSMPQFLSGTAA